MSDRQETIADIIAEMKREAAKIFPALPIAVLKLATRIEAAWKRERELTKPAGIVNSGASSDTAGNCAKLRIALETLRELLGDLLRLEEAEYHNDFLNFCDIIDAALAAPPRNCDIAQDWLRDLYVKFKPPASVKREMPPEWVDSVMAFCRWLLAPATEKEGGAK